MKLLLYLAHKLSFCPPRRQIFCRSQRKQMLYLHKDQDLVHLKKAHNLITKYVKGQRLAAVSYSLCHMDFFQSNSLQ